MGVILEFVYYARKEFALPLYANSRACIFATFGRMPVSRLRSASRPQRALHSDCQYTALFHQFQATFAESGVRFCSEPQRNPSPEVEGVGKLLSAALVSSICLWHNASLGVREIVSFPLGTSLMVFPPKGFRSRLVKLRYGSIGKATNHSI